MSRFFKWISGFLSQKDLEQAVVDAHRELLLSRTHSISIVALAVLPFTVLSYFFVTHRDALGQALPILFISEFALLVLIFCLKSSFFRKHYHLPVFVLTGVICNFAESMLLPMTGGGHFLFPYLLMDFGVATFLPGNFLWIALTLGVLPFSYLLAELWAGKGIGSDFVVSNLIYLTDVAVMAVIGNQIILSLFFREKRNQLKLHDANARLKDLDRSKSSFLATISHELKTPMTLIVNPIEQALAGKKGGKVELDEDQAEVVRRNVYRLSTLISDLIEISKGEVGKSQLVPSDIPDVGRHFQDLFEGMKPLFGEKGIEAEFGVEGEIKGHFFDIKKIDKVFYNLLGNALKFTPKGGKVMVRVWDIPTSPPLNLRGGREGILKISVSDTGIGIPSDKIDRIFERFVQVEEGATRSYEGMGIGLSLVKDFVEQHGGSVSVESEVGKGSKFTVSLPRGREYFRAVMIETKGETERPRVVPRFDLPHPVIPATEQPDSRSPGEKTVLVVEDNPDLRASIAKILREDHYNIVSAVNGQEGLEKTREIRPTLIVTDIMMPVMDGYEMIREVRKEERFRDLPIIVLTAKSGEEGLAEGFGAGADDYLTKPFSSSELRLRVKNHLEKQKLRAELVRQQNLASIGTLSAGISHNMNTYAATIAWGLDLVTSRLKKADLPEVLVGRLMDGLLGATGGLGSIRHMIKALRIYSQKNAEGFRESNIVENTKAVIELAKSNLVSTQK